VGSTSHLHNTILQNDSCTCEYYLKHINGASNMRGEWKGLQALFLNDCPYAYYVHGFAHQLQLALIAASREVVSVHEFFTNLNFIINMVGALCKRHDQLQAAQAEKIAHM